ncbi:gliding motility-associated C-terminal domain-containing protein [Flavobacterium gillisiae]|uniref:Gliding motility-associated C-terminal domain-containing protein n=1 Tax=Flavobacterium gillisiae TaxID=150146 RepID=A0A1H3XT10_9FLAO|nr:gliding motility-associated C-terminal domain-containing protein [Flavobacterium gillisiae]SEA02041.1 gliding motility-associated C-terminal domain-containing protein [Flavobacterium gillisiae]
MTQKLHYCFFTLILILSSCVYGQDISLYHQYNGRYDFVFFGNTLNTYENGTGRPCEINTSSTAILTLNPGDEIESAYLYWAGSGFGDFEVKLNNQDITAQRTFKVTQSSSGLPFFSAFTDITAQVKSTGSGVYNLSELDLRDVIDYYCWNGTNFGGWAIVLVYKNANLPLNQLTIYDGLQYVPNEINITLNSLNVIDNQDARIGFVAWEGDRSISVNETLRVNGNPISNLPLNPVDNAFNGTNSFTGSTSLYNMDLDVYNIQNNINIGDNSAKIQLTSGQDFVMINAIVTKLNSQLPDATLRINNIDLACDSRKITIDYSVYNTNSTAIIPIATPIAIYTNGILTGTTKTQNSIPIDGVENNKITLDIPNTIQGPFNLEFSVDDNGSRIGVVTELNEENNSSIIQNISLRISPKTNTVADMESCNQGLGIGFFNFSNYDDLVKVKTEDTVSFYTSLEDATLGVENGATAIQNTYNFKTNKAVTTIYIRVQNEYCFSITSFQLNTKNCAPTVHNFISPNNDNRNDTFVNKGIRDIFLNFKISIYNRWGALLWEGNNNTRDWDGYASKGILLDNQRCPDGTYYYIIELNDPDYPIPLVGFLYLLN